MGTIANDATGRRLLREAAARSRACARETWRAESDVAAVVARYLVCHPRVRTVRYPGLPGDPVFREASTSIAFGFGPHIAFELEDGSLHWLTVAPEAEPFRLVEALEALLAS